jgi:hypothetical protein
MTTQHVGVYRVEKLPNGLVMIEDEERGTGGIYYRNGSCVSGDLPASFQAASIIMQAFGPTGEQELRSRHNI